MPTRAPRASTIGAPKTWASTTWSGSRFENQMRRLRRCRFALRRPPPAHRPRRTRGASHRGAAAQAFAAYLDSGARSAVHARQEQLVHFDDLIEQRLASLDQRAGDKRVTLGLGETSEVAGIVAAPQLTELTHNPRIEIIQPGAFAEQLLDQAQAHDIAFDTRPIIRA